jgi:hypothetical protein
MVFNIGGLLSILFLLHIFWTTVLTVIIIRVTRHYNRLTGQTTKTGLVNILESILETQSRIEKQSAQHGRGISELQDTGLMHVQRLGIVRFNPFSDTGGSQSFTLALLDGQDNGVVMTSLYARTGNRWYIKKVRTGKGVDVELSREEQDAIRSARTIDRKGKRA